MHVFSFVHVNFKKNSCKYKTDVGGYQRNMTMHTFFGMGVGETLEKMCIYLEEN